MVVFYIVFFNFHHTHLSQLQENQDVLMVTFKGLLNNQMLMSKPSAELLNQEK